MKPRSWSRPLPERFLMGGERIFPPLARHPEQGWLLQPNPACPPAPLVDPVPEIPGISFHFFSHIRVQSPGIPTSKKIIPSPQLEGFSWDWIEFSELLHNDLELRTLYWVPDPSVICGKSILSNRTDQSLVILLDLVGQLQSLGSGNQLIIEKIAGRPVLTGHLGEQDLILLLVNNPVPRQDPAPSLQTSIQLQPGQESSLQWICLLADTKKSAWAKMEEVLRLDWPGEISRRKVAQQAQLEITTGDPDWDFALALSQKQSYLKYRQVTAGRDPSRALKEPISPLQAIRLLEGFAPWPGSAIKNILDIVFDASPEEELSGSVSNPAHTPPLLAGELLWQIRQTGLPQVSWSTYLAAASNWLKRWFCDELDKDRDGIPELVHPGILDLDWHESELQRSSFVAFPYLESPGLCALLYHDLCKLGELYQLSGDSTAPDFQVERENLKGFLEASWDPNKHTFQTRDSHSHETLQGFQITNQLQPGLNLLRVKLPHPARIGVLHHKLEPDDTPGDFTVTCHGLQQNGSYRIEELRIHKVSRGNQPDWGISESVFTTLEHCTLAGHRLEGEFLLVVPTTAGFDITQILPLWAGILPRTGTHDLIEQALLKPDQFWTRYGFNTSPGVEGTTIQLTWNLLLGRFLLQSGRSDLAAELYQRWMAAVIPALEQSGGLYPRFDAKTGQGVGKRDALESLLPVRFFLQTLGVDFDPSGQLLIRGKNHFPWPVTLKYRGWTILRDGEKTDIVRPGKTKISLANSDSIQIYFG